MDARWGFLRDWCAPVRDRLSFPLALPPRLPVRRFAGLGVRLPADRSAATLALLRDVRHALALLSLVARVDGCAWRHALVEYCALAVENNEDVFESELFQPRFVVCPDEPLVVKQGVWPSGLLRDWASSTDPEEEEEEAFVSAVQRVAAMNERAGRLPYTEIPLTVVVSLAFLTMDDSRVDEYMRLMWEDVAAVRSSHGFCASPSLVDDSTQLALVFVVDAVEIDAAERRLTPGVLSVMAEVIAASDGLEVDRLGVNIDPSDGMLADRTSAAEDVAELLVQLLCSDPSPTRGRLGDVKIDSARWTAPQFARLCSAVAMARSRVQLEIPLHMEDLELSTRRSIWEMLAYALFSAHSRSSVTTLTLTGAQIDVDDVEAMTRVLAADDPTELLFGSKIVEEDHSATEHHAVADTSHQLGTLQRGATVTIDPLHNEFYLNASSWRVQSDIRGVRLLESSNSNPAVKVLAPGIGVCTVHRDDMVVDETVMNQQAKRRVTSLTLSFSDGSAQTLEGLSRLLKLVGASLVSLAVHIPSGDGPLRVDAFLRWCPRLKTLVVHGSAVHTPSLVQCCNTHGIRLAQLLCDFDTFPCLAAELEDPSTLLSRTLRHLSIASRTQWASEHLKQVWAMHRMLGHNSVLEYVDVVMGRATGYMNGLHDLHHSVAVRTPLSLACRLAFISVVNGSTPLRVGMWAKRARRTALPGRRQPPRLSEALDQRVLSTIFAFAAPKAPRCVYVRYFGELTHYFVQSRLHHQQQNRNAA